MALAGKRVLIAEDNAVNMIIASTLLREWQIDVVEVVDGQAAVNAVDAAKADQRPFDLILMDVQMPKLDGFAATRILRAHDDDLARLPIVALTAGALTAEREEALASGMDAFLTKPIDEAALRQTLIRLLRAKAPVLTRATSDRPDVRTTRP